MATYLGRIQLLAKPASEWAASDPVLMLGEVGVMDAGSSAPVLKVGDGARVYSLLPTITGSGGGGGANDYVAGPTTTLPPGSPATVVIDNASDPPTISFGIPQGVAGPAGSTGATGPAGSDGATGPAGPANSLTIGTVTTGAAGSPASATITGTPPNQVLSLTIPQGAEGPQGPQGIQGVKGDTGGQGPAGAGSTPGNPHRECGPRRGQWHCAHVPRSDGAPAMSQAITPTWTGQHTFTKSVTAPGVDDAVRIVSTLPCLAWVETDAPANNRTWSIFANGEQLRGFAYNDAGTVAGEWLTVDRSGTTIDSVNFPNGTLQSAGNTVPHVAMNVTWTERHIFAKSSTGTNGDGAISAAAAVPCITWRETIAAADNRTWLAYASGEQFRLATINDANNLVANALVIDRTGTTVDTVNFPNGQLQYGGLEVGYRDLNRRDMTRQRKYSGFGSRKDRAFHWCCYRANVDDPEQCDHRRRNYHHTTRWQRGEPRHDLHTPPANYIGSTALA